MATKKSAGYQIDFTAKTLTITKEFSDNAQDPDSKEFGILMTLQNAIPGLTVIRKTHKTPRKYVSKATGEEFNCNQFKNLTFDNMEQFINLFLQITRQKVQISLCNRKAAMTEYLLKNHNRTAHSRPFFRKCVSETMNACLF